MSKPSKEGNHEHPRTRSGEVKAHTSPQTRSAPSPQGGGERTESAALLSVNLVEACTRSHSPRRSSVMTAPYRAQAFQSSVVPLHVLVIGGGIGGLCLAQGLRRAQVLRHANVSVAVYERDRAVT